VKLLLATRNEHKRRELARLLPSYKLEPLAEGISLPPEEGETFEANALAKARAAALAASGPALGEDSGIEAAALGGAPGVRSARYASTADSNASDEENVAKLLREAPAGSTLRYVCALAYADPAGEVERTFRGYCAGRLASVPRGAAGFGYDPVFEPNEGLEGLTMAELSDAQKDAISHRGHAARALLRWLRAARAGELDSAGAEGARPD
jgi:XTP/dITP diphosphohydrolase